MAKNNATFLQYRHDGPLREFSACETKSRAGIWSMSEGPLGSSEQTTVLVVNNILVRRVEEGNSTVYQPAYYSTTFQLTLVILIVSTLHIVYVVANC